MIKKNDTVRLKIHDISFDGMGIGKTEEGVVVFVKEGLLGEVIDVHILKVLKNMAFGKIKNIITPSPFRVDSFCEVYTKCGGCSFGHTLYEEELRYKENIIKTSLKTIANISFDNIEVFGYDKLNYRNKMLVPFGKNEKGECDAGFYRKRTHDVIPCDCCRISPESFNIIKNEVVKFANGKNLSVYDEETGKGLLRHLYIRKAYHTDEIMAGLVINGDSLPFQNEFIDCLVALNLNIKSIVLNINKKRTNVILGEKTVVIFGEKYITDIMNGNKVNISCQSFYQVNTPQAEFLYNKALSYLDEKNDIVFDLYCGIGTISMCLSKKAKKVYGVESCEPAVEDANMNKKLNNIDNLEFICDLSENAVPKLINDGIIPTTVVLDPPRSGCEKSLLDTIINASPKKLVYISCNPATLARDLKILKDFYEVKEVIGVDLFPKTQHVETVVLLSQLKPDDIIAVDIDLDELDITSSESKATYEEIKAYVLDKYGFKVSSLYIAQIKTKYGIKDGINYNLSKKGSRVPTCPPDKEQAITDALKYFKMID